MADPSFDIVSKVDRQEVDNALNQAAKEASTRYDFKGTGAEIAWSGESIVIKASSEERCNALLDVFKEKLVKRQVSLKTLDAGEPQQSGKEYRLTATVSEGISQDNAKKVSKVDRQEVDNALNQAAKEAATRYDFKGTGAEIAWSGESIVVKANSEERCNALLDVFKEKLVKRSISLKTLEAGEPQQSGKEYRLTATVSEGISQDNAKKVSKVIREQGPKGVQAQIQGDQLRVSAKKKDDLQAVIAMLKGEDFDFALQFTNYR